ncbi:hypothetical protein EK21DRAFT_106995 [Setomelanomma holmii]|uniref:Fatty acid hydroxylase domain-containing protein n=1 Tax=Setomelanomma holmii TaxID=210430 RepID=A0A9P4HL05_9PLEO|nr:hypothetical protein EK21DRAFT_106995 [Setomelanomma holmii]
MATKYLDSTVAFKLRVILGTLLTTSIFVPTLYQPMLTPLWTFLIHNPIYRLSTFETIWTVFLYSIIEVSMTVVFLRHPEWRFAIQTTKKEDKPITKPRDMRRPSRRFGEIAVYVLPLLAMDLTMIKKFADVPLEAMLESGNYAITNLPNRTTNNSTSNSPNTTHHKTFLIPTLHNFTLSSPLQTHRALPTLAPTSRRLALELLLAFFIYDTLFFAFHLSLHIIPSLRTLHAPHHRHLEMHPQITNQLHISERLGLVLLANFSLNIIGAHVFTRTLFVAVFVWLLVELHSGLDLPWAYEKMLPKGWGGGARKHASHHARGDGGFEPYFTWWDGGLERVGGTLQGEFV